MVKVVSVRKDKTGIKLEDGKWYKLKGVALEKALQTDLYQKEIKYSSNEDGITSFEITAEQPKKQDFQQNKGYGKSEEESKRITRQNSLTQANKLLETFINNKLIGEDITIEKIESLLFSYAEKCNKWIWEDQVHGLHPTKQPKSSDEGQEEGVSKTPLSPSSISNAMQGFHQAFLITKPLGQEYSKEGYKVHMCQVHGLSDEEAETLYNHYHEKN